MTFDYLEQAFINGMLAIFFMFLFVLFFATTLKMRSIADRYRIKYGFDYSIELKEIDNPNNLEKREKAFRKRTFRDMEDKDKK